MLISAEPVVSVHLFLVGGGFFFQGNEVAAIRGNLELE